MLTTAEAEARVAKGAAHLDSVRPGWFNEIDTGTLTLSDPCGCIVGQLVEGCYYGESFVRATQSLFPVNDAHDCGADYGVNYDFTFDTDGDAGYGLLQDAWIAAIADRRLAADVAAPALVAVSA